jgi:hypothetical protein
VPDEDDRPVVELAQPGHDGVVVHTRTVALQLEPVVEDALHVVERVRPVLMARQLD